MATTEIGLTEGDRLIVDGTLEDVEKKLSDAARSGQSRLAWFTDRGSNQPIGVNPVHVSTIRPGEDDGVTAR